MRERNRIKKPNKKKAAGLKLIAVGLILGIIVFVASFLVRQITNSDCFQIQRVKIKGDSGWLEESVGFLLKRSLLYADLSKAERVLRNEHPEIETIVLSKLWPDTVYIRFSLKIPLAALEGRQLLIDRKGFLLDGRKYADAVTGLPLIYGLSRNDIRGAGRLYPDNKLLSAVRIIELFSRLENSGNYKLIKVDVSRMPESEIFIQKKCRQGDCLIKVNVGENSYPEKLKIFQIFLKKADFDWSNVNYIDLRFKEPIVGLKNG